MTTVYDLCVATTVTFAEKKTEKNKANILPTRRCLDSKGGWLRGGGGVFKSAVRSSPILRVRRARSRGRRRRRQDVKLVDSPLYCLHGLISLKRSDLLRLRPRCSIASLPGGIDQLAGKLTSTFASLLQRVHDYSR